MSKVNRSGMREVIFKVFQRCLAEFEAGRNLCDLDDVYGRTASMTKPRNKNLPTLPDIVLAYKKHHNKPAAKMQGASEKSALDTSHGKFKTKKQESSDSEDEKPTVTYLDKPATKPASTHIGVKAAPAKKPESCQTPTPKVNSGTSATKNKKRYSPAPKKRESSSDDSDDSDDEKTKVNQSKPTPAKNNQTRDTPAKTAQVKKQKPSSDSDSSDEEPKKVKKPVQKQNTSVRATPKVQNEKSSDDSDDSDDDTTKKAPQKPASKPASTPAKTGAKAAPAKKLAPAKNPVPAKKPESSSDDSDDSSDEKSKASKQAKHNLRVTPKLLSAATTPSLSGGPVWCSDSDSSDEEPKKAKKPVQKQNTSVRATPKVQNEKSSDDSDDSDDDTTKKAPQKPASKPASTPTKTGAKAAPAKKLAPAKNPVPAKKPESSSDDSDDSSDEKSKASKQAKHNLRVTPKLLSEAVTQSLSGCPVWCSDSDSSDEEPKKAKNPVQKQNTSVRATPKVQNEKSSDDSDDSDDDTTKKAPQQPASKPASTPAKTGAKAAPAKNPVPAKKPESSSDDSDDSSDGKSKASKQAKQTKHQVKPAVSKEKSSSDEDSDEPPKQKKTVQKSQQNYTKAASKVPFIMMFSSDDSDDSSEDEKPKTNKTPIKTVSAKVLSTKSSSDSDDSSEDEKPKKRQRSATTKSKAKVLSDDPNDDESNPEPTADDDSDDSDYQPPAKVQKREIKRGECYVCHATVPLSRLRSHWFFCPMRASDDMFEDIDETSSSEEGSIDVKVADGDEDTKPYGPPQYSYSRIAPDNDEPAGLNVEYQSCREWRVRVPALQPSDARPAATTTHATHTDMQATAPRRASSDRALVADGDEDTKPYGPPQYSYSRIAPDNDEPAGLNVEYQSCREWRVRVPALQPSDARPAATTTHATHTDMQATAPRRASSDRALVADGDEDTKPYGPPQYSYSRIAPDACLICLGPYVSSTDSIHCGRVYCEVCWLQYLRDKKICLQCRAATIPEHLDKARVEHFTYSSKCDVQIVYTPDTH